ncbi:MAG: 6-bladed beta-propeller [Longimicrobiales bacterium]
MHRWTRARFIVPAIPWVLWSAACSGEGDRTGEIAVARSDSSGVEIVVISGARESMPVVAALDPVPEMRIGSPMGHVEEQFGAIRDVVTLNDGGIAVLDGQAAEVRLFDAAGQYRATLGGKGDGPGEFQSPVDLAVLSGDTLAVYDPISGRVTRFDPNAGTHQVTTLESIVPGVSDGRLLGDGQLIGQSHWLDSDGGPPPNGEPTLIRNTVALTVFDVMGRVVDTIDVVPSGEEIVSIRMSAGAVSVLKRPAAFARDNLFAPVPAGTWSSQNDRFELRLRQTSTGRLLRVVRAPSLELPVTEDIAQAIHDRVLDEAETPQERSLMETWFSLSPRPEVQPAFDTFTPDDDGRLWVREWSPFQDATRWWVFETDGALLGHLDAPSGMTITSATCDSVTGVERDELGVDYAVRYSLIESALC